MLYQQLANIHNYHKQKADKTRRDAAIRAKIRAKIVRFEDNMTKNGKK